MKKYLGIKLIEAEPLSYNDWLELQGKQRSSDDEDGYKVTYEDGYVSWSPKDVFEKAYRPIDNLTFGLAIEALKMGKKVGRVGWNGEGMFLIHSKTLFGRDIVIKTAINKEHIVLPWIGMKTADNKFVPWLASQTDVLAEDWVIID